MTRIGFVAASTALRNRLVIFMAQNTEYRRPAVRRETAEFAGAGICGAEVPSVRHRYGASSNALRWLVFLALSQKLLLPHLYVTVAGGRISTAENMLDYSDSRRFAAPA